MAWNHHRVQEHQLHQGDPGKPLDRLQELRVLLEDPGCVECHHAQLGPLQRGLHRPGHRRGRRQSAVCAGRPAGKEDLPFLPGSHVPSVLLFLDRHQHTWCSPSSPRISGFFNKQLFPRPRDPAINWYIEPIYWPFHPHVHEPVEVHGIFQRDLPGGHRGHRSELLRGRRAGRREQVAGDHANHDPPHLVRHHHPGAAVHRAGCSTRTSACSTRCRRTWDPFSRRRTSSTRTSTAPWSTSGDIGMSAAAGLYQSVVGFVLVLVSNLDRAQDRPGEEPVLRDA